MGMEQWLINDLQCKTKKIWRKTCSIAPSSTTNLACSQLGLNPRLHGEKHASNYLTYGMLQVKEHLN
jgi:hypothetical protein